MNTITRMVVYFIITLTMAAVHGQGKEQDSIIKNQNVFKESQIEKLKALKTEIENEERNLLKNEIEIINRRLDNDEITASEAEDLKKEAAVKRAANIENRLAIIDNKIALIERNEYDRTNTVDNNKVAFSIDGDGVYINLGKNEKTKTPPKYDIRTTNDLLFAIGFNNTLIDGQSLDDSPYKLGGSGFVELGWNWNTRVFKNSNVLRFKYGFSFQWNKLDIKDDQFFVQDGDETTLQEFPVELKKAKFRVTNLVIPIHFEFGPSKKRDYTDRLRYTTDDQFKIGIGGYGGVNIGAQQKLKYKDDGDRVKDKIRRNYNASTFVYGLSAYVGVGDLSLYAKYDLSPLFKDQMVEQNNISLGLRWDLD